MSEVPSKNKVNASDNNLISAGVDKKNVGKLNILPKNSSKKRDFETTKQTSETYKKGRITLIMASVIIFFTIAVAVLIIGHFKYGWFMKKNDLVIIQNREVNLVSRFVEQKKASNYYDVEGLDEDQRIKDNIVSTDFIVGINKRKKINSIFDFKENDYLYESFLLIINLTLINETNSQYLGGLNIFDKSKSAEELIKLNDEFFLQIITKEKNINITNKTNKTSFIENIPFCKFYYFQNGTIDKIYFPKGMDEFYKSAMTDLIEKITPKLSKSLYQDKANKRRLQNEQEEGIKLNYEKIIKNGEIEKIIIYEDNVQKDFHEKNTELNSKIIRTFNSSGDITSLEMKGEVKFKSFSPDKKDNTKKNNEKKNLRFAEEAKDIYYRTNDTNDNANFGFNEFSMNITSNMELIQNGIEPKILEKLLKISKLISFEIYKEPEETFTYDEKKENITNNTEIYPIKSNETIKRNLVGENIINFPHISNAWFVLYDKYVRNKRVIITQHLYINPYTNLRTDTLILNLDQREYILDELSIKHDLAKSSDSRYNYIPGKKYGIGLDFPIFGFSIRVTIYFYFRISHGINYSVKYNQMYTKAYASHDVSVDRTLGPNFYFVSLGVGMRGSFMGGYAYIEGNPIPNTSLTRFRFHGDFVPLSIDLIFYFTVNFIFWKKTYEETFNIFKIYLTLIDDYKLC